MDAGKDREWTRMDANEKSTSEPRMDADLRG
jgi:hypothetical protein